MNSLRQKYRRRATLVLSVMASLALVMLLMAAWVKIIALERQQLRAQQNRMQAECLAASGLERAAARLASDPAYTGETITASPESLGAASAATVKIRVEAAGDDAQARLVTASAQVPATGPQAALRTQQKKVHLPTKEQTP